MRSSSEAAAAVVLMSACGASVENLRSRAAFDLSCAQSAIEVVQIDRRTQGVTGCGQRATYVEECETATWYGEKHGCTWVRNSEVSGRTPPRVPQTPAEPVALHEPAPSVPPSKKVAPEIIEISPPSTRPDPCSTCPETCAAHKAGCNGGNVSACYRLGACLCQCKLAGGGCGEPITQLTDCVAKNSEKAGP